MRKSARFTISTDFIPTTFLPVAIRHPAVPPGMVRLPEGTRTGRDSISPDLISPAPEPKAKDKAGEAPSEIFFPKFFHAAARARPSRKLRNAAVTLNTA